VPIALTFNVAGGIESGEVLTQDAWMFLPDRPSDARAALLCLAGGTYDKHYWHLEVGGHTGYSFGEHMAKSGYIVVAVDHLGVGASTDPVRSGPLGLHLLAAGDAEVARQLRRRLYTGRLARGVAPLEVPVVGVGHSMGACLTTIVHALTDAYDAVVLLGHAVNATSVHDATTDGVDLEARVKRSIERFRRASGANPDDSHAVAFRDHLAPMFYAADVPNDVLVADTAVQTRVPVQAAGEITTAGFAQHYTAELDVPVFLAFGAANDVSPNPYAEPAYYTACPDVTLHLVPKSGHCHNLASHRAGLWDRIAAWIPAVT